MKKLIITLLLFLFAMPAVCAAEKEVFSFRGVELGMTMDEVKSLETGILLKEGEEILYYDIEDVYDLKAYIDYKFNVSGRLVKIALFLMVPAKMDHKVKYAEIKADLWAKYKDGEEPEYDAGWRRFKNDVTFTQILDVEIELAIDQKSNLVVVIMEFSSY